MAISQVGGTENASKTSGVPTTLTINKPTGVAVGDFMMLGITSDGTVPTATGWTKFGGGTHGSATWNNHLYYRWVDGSEGSSFSITVGTTGPAAGFINAWRGVDSTNPINGFIEAEGTTSAEPNTTPNATVTVTTGHRMYYCRAVRDAPGDGSATAIDMTEATADVSRRVSIGSASSTGNTSYSISHFSSDISYTGSGTYNGLAISANPIGEDHNYEATWALKAAIDPSTGDWVSTLSPVTSSFAGERESNSGTLAATTPMAVAAADGTHLIPATGTMAATTPKATASALGAVDPVGPLAATLPLVQVVLVTETRQFGEHIIVVEQDHRAFLVVDDGTDVGLKPIKRSRVTDA